MRCLLTKFYSTQMLAHKWIISSFCYLEIKLDIIPVNKGVGTFLKVFVLAASLCRAFLSPRTHKYLICNIKNTTVQTISLISFCAILSQSIVSATMQNSIKKNRILACSINFLSQRNTDLLLPKHSSTLQGKPSLPALLEKARSEHFCAQQKRAYTRAVGGTSTGVHSAISGFLSRQVTGHGNFR